MKKKSEAAAPVEEEGVKYLSSGPYEPGFLNCEEFTELTSDTLPLTSCRAYKIFFSEESENFLKNYHEKRGDSELKIGEWKADANPKFGITRLITFRAPVNASIGPSSTKVEENQRYHLTKEKLIVESATNLLDIPYGDHFRVETKFEFATTGDKSKITISTAVFFFKKTMFRGKIESGTLKESKDSFEQWVFFAKNEINRLDGKEPIVEVKPVVKAPAKAEALFGNRGLAVILLGFSIIITYLILRVMSLAKTVHELEYYLELNIRNQQQIHQEL